MSKKEIYEQKAEALVSPIVEKYGFELVDVEYVKEGGSFYLRAYIDKPGGITVDDCETVSREFSDKLEDMIRFLIPNYIAEGKTQLVISVGCTGGKHRSVTLANELYRRLGKSEEYGLRIEHRDIEKDGK